MEAVEQEIQDMVDRETNAWNRRDAGGLVSVFHPDMVWPWPPDTDSHDPALWISDGTIQSPAMEANLVKTIAAGIGKANEQMIRSCDVVLGVLDGTELDSGTASEIGFAAALGKTCHGLRTDFRDCGEFDGQPFNLQVLYWIESSGGRLFRRIEETVF